METNDREWLSDRFARITMLLETAAGLASQGQCTQLDPGDYAQIMDELGSITGQVTRDLERLRTGPPGT